MAEVIAVFGYVASVTQLTGQLLESVAKLHSFWRRLQGAPKQISDLFDDISGLATMINSMPDMENEMVKECCLKVKQIMDDLLYRLEILHSKLKRKRKHIQITWVKFQTLLKQDMLRELTERLEKAKSQMMLAMSIYQMFMHQNMQHEVVMLRKMLHSNTQPDRANYSLTTQSSETNNNLHATSVLEVSNHVDSILDREPDPPSRIVPVRTTEPVEFVIKTYWCGFGRLHKVQTRYSLQDDETTDNAKRAETKHIFLPNRFTARLRLRGFSYQSTMLFGRWTRSFTSLRVVPNNAPIFLAVALGDLVKVISLIKQKEASIFDTNEHGWTLLHFAASYFRKDVCRWLIAHGLKGDIVEFEDRWTPLHVAAGHSALYYHWPSFHHEQVISRGLLPAHQDVGATIRVLVEEGQCDPTIDTSPAPWIPAYFTNTPLSLYNGHPETFRYLLHQEHFMVDVDSSRPEMEHLAFLNIIYGRPYGPALARICLAKGNGMQYLANSLNNPILHSISKNIKQNLGENHRLTQLYDVKQAFKLLLVDALRAGADLHARNDDQHTPLGTLAGTIFPFFDKGELTDQVSDRILFWLDALRAAGCDLQQYIQEESIIYKSRALLSQEFLAGAERRERLMYLEQYSITDNIILRIKENFWAIDRDQKQGLFAKFSEPCSKIQKFKLVYAEEVCFLIGRNVDGDQEFGLWPQETKTQVVETK